MKFNRLLITIIAFPQFTAVADETTTNCDMEIETLKQQIEKLDQKVRVLECEGEMDKDDAATTARAQPRLTLDGSGFTLSSADTNFVLTLHGLIQFDSRIFFSNSGGTLGESSFLLRKARPIITGTVFHDFNFNFTPEFGGSSPVIYDAYLNYRYNPELQLEAGKFKSPVGLELLQPDTWLSFNERSLATDLVPNRDLGVELHGDLFGGVASYAAGIFNGAPDYSTPTLNVDSDDDRGFAGRLFFQPWKTSKIAALQGLGFGIGGSYDVDRNGVNGLTGGYVTDGQQKFFTYATGVTANGTHWRISPQGYYYFRTFSLLGEYVISHQEVSRTTAPLVSADLQNTALEISAGWVLTGENASYNGLTPKHPLDPRKGQWGAWQVVARYADLDVDDAAFAPAALFASAGSASEAKAWSVGVNWYLNRDIRVNASFSRTMFTGGGGANGLGPTASQPENVLFTRIQLAF